MNREAMWPAPTAADWKKPCLIQFQRTWEDAVTVSRETGKPILVCINMDGEIASEHYAGVRYRDAEIAKLYEPYVCVAASVYRHNPRDHDDQGRRILCPRLGSVTCGEHIWIEPIIFEKFCDGQRVAPRHICVDLDGKEAYDVYYANDTASVFAAIRDGRAKLPPAKEIVVKGDRPIVERVASRDIADRVAVESAYAGGDKALRQSLLDAALKHKETEQLDLLRLAVFGLDADLGKSARRALFDVSNPDATQLVSDALQVPMEDAERAALLGTLKRLGQTSPLARYLAGVHQGLSGATSTVDLKGWSEKRAGAEYPAVAFGGGGGANAVEERTAAAEEKPQDPAAHLDLAEATLVLALNSDRLYPTNARMARLAADRFRADALRFAAEARGLGAKGWRMDTVLALATYYAGRTEEAYGLAAEAMKALPPGDPGWSSMALVTIFAESRWKAIKAAVRENKDWPPEWLADVHAAYSILLRHPLGTDSQVVWHYEFLDWLGAQYKAARVLDEGIARFRNSEALHQRLRERLLKWQGPDALEAAYDRMLSDQGGSESLEAFAGAASVEAAAQHRRVRNYEKALASYGRAIAHYERAGDGIADRAHALALAGRARVAYEMGDESGALADSLASLARAPSAAGDRDLMGISPGETAQMLLARLRKANNKEGAGQVEQALSRIDPELLAPDREAAPER